MFMFELAAVSKKYRDHEHLSIIRKEEYAMNFVKLLTRHFKEEQSGQYYADTVFVTPKHLTKIVKEVSGKTAGEMIDEMVIVEAKILLHDPARSIYRVAEDLYFSDQFFKSHTGLSPSAFKNN